ncbi:MAG: phage protease, partial [Candidatus Paceibacterota bacterium]
MKQKAFVTALYALEGNPFIGPQWKPGTELPATLLVLRSGANQSNQGVFNVSAATAQIFSSFMRDKGRDRVTIDFEHNTLEGTPAYKEAREPRPVAGRGIPLLTPNGIELTNIEWTSEGRKMAEHFGDISPAPWHEKDGTVLGLHSVALVRNGAIYDLSFCSADNQNTKENEMKDLLAALSAAKLIPENGTESDVAKLIQDLNAKADASKAAVA